MLFDTAVDMKDVEKAKTYLDKMSPDSPRRADAELRLGQMYWAQYIRQTALEEGERPSQEVLDDLVEKAQQTLRQGIDRMSTAVDAGRPGHFSAGLLGSRLVANPHRCRKRPGSGPLA